MSVLSNLLYSIHKSSGKLFVIPPSRKNLLSLNIGVNNNGIRITRTGTYGNVTFNFYGRAISANGTSNWTSGYTKFLDGAF